MPTFTHYMYIAMLPEGHPSGDEYKYAMYPTLEMALEHALHDLIRHTIAPLDAMPCAIQWTSVDGRAMEMDCDAILNQLLRAHPEPTRMVRYRMPASRL